MSHENARMFMVESPSADPHQRTTHLTADSTVEVYVLTKHDWQVEHTHHFAELTRFGGATCHGCGAYGWSKHWVAAGVYSEGTHAWMLEQERMHRDRLDQSTIDLLADTLGAIEVIAADLDERQPAKVYTRA